MFLQIILKDQEHPKIAKPTVKHDDGSVVFGFCFSSAGTLDSVKISPPYTAEEKPKHESEYKGRASEVWPSPSSDVNPIKKTNGMT